jgi:signal transduction histidine kinase
VDAWRPALFDAALAVGVTAAVAVAIAVASEPVARPPDAGAYGLAAVIGGASLLRRRWPLAVLAVSVLALMVYYAAEYPGIPPALPLAVPLASVAAVGRLRWAALVTGCFVVLELLMRRYMVAEQPLPALAATVTDAALMTVAVLLGEAWHSRRVRLARAEAVRERETAGRVAQERLRIAREVHDVLGHTLAAITVHAGLADDVLDDRPEQARQALRTIRATAREAMREVRATVGVLRSPTPGLGDLAALAETARGTGLDVEVAAPDPPVPVPSAVGFCAYRIVQEALTNAVRHAHATHATRVRVEIGFRAGTLTVRVSDDGVGSPAPTGGSGLRGMAERAAAVGGRLSAGPLPGRGFRVSAELSVAGGPA